MTEMIPTQVNGRWELLLPAHRHVRPEWPWWEAQRLAAERHVIGEIDGSFGSHDEHPVVYCVGAEEGDFPALYASWGADVVLFEPNARVWPNIKAIFEANHLEDRVLGTFEGFAGSEFRGVPLAGQSIDRVWPPCADGPLIGDHGFCNLWERPDIASTTIDNTAEAWVPDMITIDVEGAELEVLRGAQATLKQHHPVVFVSIHPTFMMDGYNDHPNDLQALMREHGYESRFLCTDHEQHWYFQHPDNRRMRIQ
jgi:FkbM family methyltransferase